MHARDHRLACADDDRRAAVVLVHAFPFDGRMWQAQRHALSAHTRVLVPDLPGFGASAGFTARPDLDAWADHLEDTLVRRLGSRAAVVCGLSMGGYVALRLAARHPARVAALVLADTRARPDDDAGRGAREQAIHLVRTAGVAAFVDALLPKLLADTSPLRLRERVRGLAVDQSPTAVITALEAMRDRPDSTPVLAGLTVPALFVVGEHDAITPPEEARTMAAAVPGGRLEIVAGAGHLANLERPDAFTAAVEGLLDRLTEAAAVTGPGSARRTAG